MKNLHKKIGVVVLSGLVLSGVGLALNPSVANAMDNKYQKELSLELMGRLPSQLEHDSKSLDELGKIFGFNVLVHDYEYGKYELDYGKLKILNYGFEKYYDGDYYINGLALSVFKSYLEENKNLENGIYYVNLQNMISIIKVEK